MAAKRNMSEFVKIKKFVIIAVVYLIFACNLFETGIRGIGAQSTDAVTDSTTDDLNVTDFSTVTDSTAQPAVPTLAATTRATPTQPQSGTLANTGSDTVLRCVSFRFFLYTDPIRFNRDSCHVVT